ncbi:MAG: CarD family transcriptional regulator, partial [Candidatus Pelethousia sp.]|nr:CarD family transcriptional regulator [Candidatus Pelethousia sp.]
MSQHPLLGILSQHPEYMRLREALANGEGPCGVFGLSEASKGHVAAGLFADTARPLVFVAPNESMAEKLCEEMACYVPCLHFPARDIPLTGAYTSSEGLEARRVDVLCRLAAGAGNGTALTVSIEALMQRLAPPDALRSMVRTVQPGDILEPRALLSALLSAGYQRVDLCESRCQVCLRGGYLDVFPISAENPVRIEFFDDEVDTLRTYDPLTQRSIENIDSVKLPPATEMPLSDQARKAALARMKGRPALADMVENLSAGGTPDGSVRLLPLFYETEYTLLDYLDGALFLIDEPARVEESAKMAHSQFLDLCTEAIATGGAQGEQAQLLCSPLQTIKLLDTPRTALLFSLTRTYGLIGIKSPFRFETRPVSRYVGDEALLCEDLAAWQKAGTTVLIYAGPHAERLRQRLEDMDAVLPCVENLDRPIVKGERIILGQSLERGYEYSELGLVVVSENELYGDVIRSPKKARRNRPQLAFSELNVGDLVVHELHGIGRFVGVVTLTVDNAPRDYLHLVYAGGDKLYIPTDQLDRVQKYIGGGEDGAASHLSKLGSGEWQRTVSRTREGVKKLAFDLVRLYGERQKIQGFSFLPDNAWQRRLEENFPYEETPDQLTSIAEIKADMESGRVMDRLL